MPTIFSLHELLYLFEEFQIIYYLLKVFIFIYVYVIEYMCVCVCVCMPLVFKSPQKPGLVTGAQGTRVIEVVLRWQMWT